MYFLPLLLFTVKLQLRNVPLQYYFIFNFPSHTNAYHFFFFFLFLHKILIFPYCIWSASYDIELSGKIILHTSLSSIKQHFKINFCRKIENLFPSKSVWNLNFSNSKEKFSSTKKVFPFLFLLGLKNYIKLIFFQFVWKFV